MGITVGCTDTLSVKLQGLVNEVVVTWQKPFLRHRFSLRPRASKAWKSRWPFLLLPSYRKVWGGEAGEAKVAGSVAAEAPMTEAAFGRGEVYHSPLL